jgi:hypothetical protein
MATIPGAVLLCASSPYARRGALWDAHRKHFGKEGDPILVWQADTRTMNPGVPQSVIDDAMERDAASATAEFGAQFRSDLEAYVNREAIEACVSTGVYERPPVRDTTYRAFIDPSGGSADSFIRRFLIHVLPKGFHRIRHYGLLASANRAANIAHARELLAVPSRPKEPKAPAAADEPRVLPRPCPCCGGRMIVIETFERGCEPKHRPTPAPFRIDTS